MSSPTESLKTLLNPHAQNIGFSVRHLDGKEIIQLNGLKPMTPASVAKMVSSACSLEALGPEFKFETDFGAKDGVKDGVAMGGLVVRGAGDPSFVIENLKQIIEILRVVFEIKEIRGKLIFDVSYFGKESLSIGDGFEGDEGRSFATELTAVPFNHNSFSLWIAPGSPKPLVHLMPDFAMDLKIKNNAQTTGGSSQNLSIDYRKPEKTVSVSGSIGRDAPAKSFYRAIDDPYSSFARLFARVWREMGGSWQNPSYEISKSAVGMKKIYTHESLPVSRLLLDINKISTNFGAELVGLAASEKRSGRPVTQESLGQFLENCVKDFGLSPSALNLKNASGLSRSASISASALTDFLSKLRTKTYFPEYLSTLSILGRDGTTRSRMKGQAGRARLKTGSIKGVRSMAGFVYPASEQPLIFSLFFNGAKIPDAEIQNIENEIIDLLLEM